MKSLQIALRAGRILLGAGLASLAAFSGVVIWLYVGKWGSLTDALVVLFAIFSACALVQRWRGTIHLGFGWRAGLARELFLGFGIGALAWLGIFLAQGALGAIRVEGVRPDLGALVATLGTLAGLAAYEEVMFRVLILGGMVALFKRPWLAVALSAVMFGLVHLNNADASALGLASNALGGMMYGIAFVRTGRIWMPIGLHAAWNWVQGPVLGFDISGVTEWSGHLVRQVAVGDALITGGAYGESSVVVIAFRYAIIALVLLATRPAIAVRGRRTPLTRASGT